LSNHHHSNHVSGHALSQHRSDHLDRIRVVLTALVILHHTAIMFGADGGWYVRHAADSTLAKGLLTVFCAVNQSFFMGAFFLLAGYFTPRSLESKGLWRFSKERFSRLGLPILVYGFLLGPLTIALVNAPTTADVPAHWANLIGRFTFNIGPLWFAYALLLFAALFVVVRQMLGQRSWALSLSALNHTNVLLLAVTWGVGAFLLRLWIPVGKEVALLQIGYFSSYVLLFAIGCAAAQHQLLEQVDGSLAKRWTWISVITIPTLFAYAAASGAFAGRHFAVQGGWTIPALVYAFWEPLVGIGIMLMLLWRTRVAAKPWQFWRRLAPLAYGAFIVHPPIVVAIGIWVLQLHMSSLLKFVVTGILAVSASFLVASLLIRLPGARRVL
jgi:glucans biosynthesis protein C